MTRTAFIIVTVFWLTMNTLLWRAEFGSDKKGGAVPIQTVWEKILTAADDSSLTVFQHGKFVGSCRWRTGVGQEWANVSNENLPNGLPEKNRGYRLQLDGSALITGEQTNRVRFEGAVRWDRKRDWQELDARLNIRPATWKIHSVASERSVKLQMENGDETFQRVFKMTDFQNPAALFNGFLGSFGGELFSEAGLFPLAQKNSTLAMGLKWEARDGSLKIGHTTVQVYQLRTRLLDRYEVTVIVSRAGEILRVELPNEFILVNDRLGSI